MKLINKINKPYTLVERAQFITDYNQAEIRETETALEAWGYTVKEKKEQKRLYYNSLFLTAADVERAIYKAKGMDFEDLIELTKDNPDIDTKALKIELKANNFFRGNPYINQIGEILGFSQIQLDKFFETNNYEELINADLV